MEEALLKRRGLVESSTMKSRWAYIEFVYEGQTIRTPSEKNMQDELDLTKFSWVMVSLTASLRWCLSDHSYRKLLTDFFLEVLLSESANDNEARNGMVQSLRALLPDNIACWKSLASARHLDRNALRILRNRWRSEADLGDQELAIPQLNRQEEKELTEFLIWLLRSESVDFQVYSSMVYSVAKCTEDAGIKLRTSGNRRYESEPFVHYIAQENNDRTYPIWYYSYDDPRSMRKNIQPRTPQISYPYGTPESMIETRPFDRDVKQDMEMLWHQGVKAGRKVSLKPSASHPFTPTSDIDYSIDFEKERVDKRTSNFGPQLNLLGSHAFPFATQSILAALELLIKGQSDTRIEWLERHTAPEYLQRQTSLPSKRRENIEIFQKYSALGFGFYHQLLRQLVSFDYVKRHTYFRGIWGDETPLFLTMCTQLSTELGRGSVSRTHILHVLTSMYNGRQKMFSPSISRSGLLGIFGDISVLSMSLVQVSDRPTEISRFAVIDLPIIDLMPSENNGELYANHELGIDFFMKEMERGGVVTAQPPTSKWSVEAKMGMLFGEGEEGVVMAARCQGRLVGWFSPLAADVMFLSAAYQVDSRDQEADEPIKGFEVTDEQWQQALVQRPCGKDMMDEDQVLLVQSKSCPPLRYAATGFYTIAKEEVAIATDNIRGASQWIQGPGVVVA